MISSCISLARLSQGGGSGQQDFEPPIAVMSLSVTAGEQ